MNKKLPKIYSNKIDKTINNNTTYYASGEIKKNEQLTKDEVLKKIKELFKSTDYIYRLNTIITLKDKEINKKIIGIEGSNLLTIDGEYILIDDILNIKIKD